MKTGHLITLLGLVPFTGCSLMTTTPCTPCTSDAKTITLEALKKSLESTPPTVVGFDIDDTVLFSTPGFFRGKQMFSPGSEKYLYNQKFWQKMNNGWDQFSTPKEIAKKLIQFHQDRGDKIYFITARTKTKTETVTPYLKKIYNIKDMSPVIFTGHNYGGNSKTAPIKNNKVQIYYGDADKDMEAAQQAGARAIRVIRPTNSGYQPLPVNGGLGEEVLLNSEF